MAHAARTPEPPVTYEQYAALGSDERYELVDGVLYAMAPAPLLDHQAVVGELYFQLRSQLEGQPCRPFVAPVDVRLPEAGQDDAHTLTVLQPDVFVVCDPAKLDTRGVRGAPDFVIEVLSPATAARDHLMKRRAYERAGVREYWLVHPVDRLLTLYRRGDTAFDPPVIQELADHTPVAALPGVTIAWEPVLRVLTL